MDRLEDYLLPENLREKKTSLLQSIREFIPENSHGIDVIIDDGGISEHEQIISEIMREGEIVEFPDYLLNDPEIVGYPDEEMQNEIYSWVDSKLPNQNFSVKDLGCGRGDFISQMLFGETGNQYIGIDSNPNLIEVGRQKYPGINLINDNFLNVDTETDYTICIGTLNDDHGFNKWGYFNKTLNHALNTTKKSIIFVLSANSDDIGGFLEYPIHEMVQNLGTDLLFEIDYSKFKDIYLLTVHIGGYDL